MTGTLSDGTDPTIFTFSVKVIAALSSAKSLMNIGPPVFFSALPQISVTPNQTFIYKIPSITDPDDDKYTVTVLLGSTTPFVKYD